MAALLNDMNLMTELEQYFTYKCWKGLEDLGLADKPEYQERLQHEITIINQMGYAEYFMVVSNILNWAKSNNCLFGPGRGSCVGSLVAFSLGITNSALDPIEYKLLFERFLSPGRAGQYIIDFPEFSKKEFDNLV